MQQMTKDKASHFLFTIHNYTSADLERVKTIIDLPQVLAITWGEEMGKSGKTPHIQGYIQVNKHMRFKALQKMFNLPDKDSFATQEAYGSWEQNVIYCLKEQPDINWKHKTKKGRKNTLDNKWNEFWTDVQIKLEKAKKWGILGNFKELGRQGARNDIKKALEWARDGYKPNELVDMGVITNWAQWHGVKNMRREENITNVKPRDKAPINIIVYGLTGVGKTTRVMEDFGPENVNKGMKFGEFRATKNYNGQEVFLLDDLRWGQVDLTELTEMMDEWPYVMNVKYGEPVQLNSEYFIITMQQKFLTPEELFLKYYEEKKKDESWGQIARRCWCIKMTNENRDKIKLNEITMSKREVMENKEMNDEEKSAYIEKVEGKNTFAVTEKKVE